MTRTGVVMLVLVVLVAGCSGGNLPFPTPAPTPSNTETPVLAAASTPAPAVSPAHDTEPTATATATPPPTETDTVDERSANPWGEAPIVVGVAGLDESPNNYSTSLRRAIEYWRGVEHPALAYSPEFRFDPNADDPHVVVQFTPKITRCGPDAEGALGCAPVLTNSTRAFHPEVVQVQLGLTNESTYRVARHELGHLLGLEHGEGPDGIMRPTGIVHERVVRVSIAFETSAAGVQRDSRRQVRHALEYYAGGAEGFLEEDVSFAIIENASAADVIVRFEESGRGSTGSGTQERYVIAVEGVDVDRRGWHVGYWLGFYLVASSQEELPPPFDEPDADRRERWW